MYFTEVGNLIVMDVYNGNLMFSGLRNTMYKNERSGSEIVYNIANLELESSQTKLFIYY